MISGEKRYALGLKNFLSNPHKIGTCQKEEGKKIEKPPQSIVPYTSEQCTRKDGVFLYGSFWG